MTSIVKNGGVGFADAVRRITAIWALFGSAVLLLVIAVNMYSVIGSIFGAPFPGDFELTEAGAAIAAFAFLPYCQISGANVTADIFTAGASPRLVAFLTLIGGVIAFVFGAILLWRMYFGMLEQKTYNYTTAILQIPQWYFFVPILISLALLVLAAAATISEQTTLTKAGEENV